MFKEIGGINMLQTKMIITNWRDLDTKINQFLRYNHIGPKKLNSVEVTDVKGRPHALIVYTE